ncbi:ABC1 kinase family protein [Candidatus Nanohalovita haloferacivicina]|uniref:ABC1 kinase family protein n=1 Tax=Candidatus Nanohalovita haloferacivicina TaxID=2978046 RepID=UPI00325FC9B7|nr:Ubiquinone biosynthesis protein [Candidatus Nanohalobia archaeon BNXNv]
MGLVENKIGDVERFDEIISIMAEQGLGVLLDELDLFHRVSVTQKFSREKVPPPERLRETFEQLGPTFIKFGQIMAERPDVVPERYVEELEKLQDDVPGFESEKAKQIVDEEIGLDKFENFEEEHLAAASIAQVHRATLNSGEEVVVKIRRPGIKDQIERDLEIIEFLAKRGIKRSDYLSDVQLLNAVKEFARWTRQELNLKREARNGELLAENLSDEENIKIPEIYAEMTTQKVMVMEYVDGIKSSKTEKLREMDIDNKKLAETAIRSSLKQILRDGFFHADPHPSNFLVREDGTLIMIDFGMMGNLTKDTRENMALMILHSLREDVDKAFDDLKRMGHVQSDADEQALKAELEEKILLIQNANLEEVSFTGQFLDMTIQASRHGVIMPQSLVLMGKSMVTMEGIGMAVYPEYEINDQFKKTIKEILRDDFKPEKLMKELSLDLVENKDLITELPSKLNELTEKEDTEVKVVNEGGDNRTLEAGLIISSAFLVTQGQKELIALGALEMAFAAYLFNKNN